MAATRFEIPQREFRCVVECLARSGTQSGALLGDARVVEHLFGVEHRRLRSRTASRRRSTHMGRMTSGYLPRLKRSRRISSAIPQMKETILLLVAWSMERS